MAETILSLRNVTVIYGGAVALDIDALDVHPREVLAILGPNGAGKSTLLRVMGFLQKPDRGSLKFHDSPSESHPALELRRRVATMFHEPLLLNQTVFQNAALGLRLRGIGKKETAQRLEPWLARLNISHLAERRAHTLSSGEAQRTCLARALVLEPELLLLDEPFSALDPGGRELLIRDFRKIVADHGVTTVLVTHDRSEGYALADRIAVLNAGRLEQAGSRDEVFCGPATEVAAAVVGIENRLCCRVIAANQTESRLRIGHAEFAVHGSFPAGTEVVFCIRASDLMVAPANSPLPGLIGLDGVVTAIFPGMEQLRCTVATDGGEFFAAVAAAHQCASNLKTGKQVQIAFDPVRAHIFESK